MAGIEQLIINYLKNRLPEKAKYHGSHLRIWFKNSTDSIIFSDHNSQGYGKSQEQEGTNTFQFFAGTEFSKDFNNLDSMLSDDEYMTENFSHAILTVGKEESERFDDWEALKDELNIPLDEKTTTVAIRITGSQKQQLLDAAGERTLSDYIKEKLSLV